MRILKPNGSALSTLTVSVMSALIEQPEISASILPPLMFIPSGISIETGKDIRELPLTFLVSIITFIGKIWLRMMAINITIKQKINLLWSSLKVNFIII